MVHHNFKPISYKEILNFTTPNCPATAQAVLVELATETEPAKYVCSRVGHNHEPNELSLKRASESLKK